MSACGPGQLQPAGPVSFAERQLLINALAIMLAIVIPVIVATLVIAVRFAATRTRAPYSPAFVYSGRIELVIWSIPLLVIFFLGGLAWVSAHLLDPARPLPSRGKPLEIQVVSLDWKWLFIYPEQDIASINRLVVPVGVPLRLHLTSASVWNVFWVPQLGTMLYCMRGMSGLLNLQADQPGIYTGRSAMLSGDGFADMQFDAQAVSSGQFTSWVQQARAAGRALNDSEYRGLLRQSARVAPRTYKSVRAGLFNDIVLQRLPPGEGPQIPSRSASLAELPES